MKHEAMFWKEENGKVRCELCARRCLIDKGKVGICGVRMNEKGKLYSLNYGKIVALNFDPIEKKPLYHFYPGSIALSYSCPGCNWKCVYCCNWEISQVEGEVRGRETEPEELVKMAVENEVKIISHTYTEPTVFFEFALDVARLAKKEGLMNTFVTNGYIEEKPLKKIARFLDAVTVDVKASGDEKFLAKYASVPSMEPVKKTLVNMVKLGIHLEITDLVVPDLGDDQRVFTDFITWVKENLGKDIPIHLIRFFPSYKMLNVKETPVKTLEKLASVAKEIGMEYVYIGNVFGHELENTYCPNCGSLVVKREGFFVESMAKEGRCPKCGLKIKGVMRNIFS